MIKYRSFIYLFYLIEDALRVFCGRTKQLLLHLLLRVRGDDLRLLRVVCSSSVLIIYRSSKTRKQLLPKTNV